MTDALDLPGWTHVYSGKVRDLYRPDHARPGAGGPGADERMLVVASDRVSAFDHVLSPGIPGKGVLLTTLSLWWFDQLAAVGADGEANTADDLVDLIPA
ncbi:phosphoribosylaminoimidazolesuccinocarboxamide synthase, partial [Microbacterium lacticum]|uniref:phosphoribosylaminoimidazolesuccinocarboxamide synthase n=1 Tax=Microbacterium lacticum TaxID=33885 RepID=UPI00242E1243